VEPVAGRIIFDTDETGSNVGDVPDNEKASCYSLINSYNKRLYLKF